MATFRPRAPSSWTAPVVSGLNRLNSLFLRAISFRGRTRRRDFATILLWFGLGLIFITSTAQLAPLSGMILLILFAASIRRLHDLGRSGWFWLAPVGFLCLLMILAASLTALAGPALILGLLSQVGFVGLLAILPGTKGPNAYGEDVPS